MVCFEVSEHPFLRKTIGTSFVKFRAFKGDRNLRQPHRKGPSYKCVYNPIQVFQA
jgi:hypothetical protein